MNNLFLQTSKTASTERRIGLSLLVLVAILTLIAFQPYYYGYRMSRDDVWFLKAATHGAKAIFHHGLLAAIDQGRIGHLLMTPLNMLGSLLAGDPLWRVGFLALYLVQLLLFSVFISRLLRQDVSLFLFLLLVALHPLLFENMPPNAYPLQNTVPFIVVLASRLVILDQRRRDNPSRLRIALAQTGFALGMFVTEFAITLGTALLIAEYLERLHWQRQAGNSDSGKSWVVTFREAFARRFLVSDGLAVLVVLVPYGVFRWLHPSIYEGNSAEGILEIERIVGTAFWHMVAGTPARFIGESLPPVAIRDGVVAIVFGAAVAFCLFRLAAPVIRIKAPWSVAVVAIFLAFYVGLPLAITPKYQQECMEWSKCGYLDSRISYLPFVVAVMCLFAMIGRLPLRRVTTGVASVLVGATAALVFLHNAEQARLMQEFNTVWTRGNAAACIMPTLIEDEAAFIARVDPKGLVEMHPPTKPIEFWSVYIPWKAARSCGIASP